VVFPDGRYRVRALVPARALPLLALCVVIAALAPGCRSADSPPATAAFVGSAACAGCHETEHRSWETSYHHRAMLPASSSAPLHAGPTGDGPLLARDGQLFLSGERLEHPTDVPVSWVLGHRTIEQYLGTVSPGSVQALPIAFDVGRGQWFDLFAGDPRTPADWGHWTNRGMTANTGCIACHTTGFEKGYQQDSDTYDSRWVEPGVGCEACHGPGGAHIRARNTGAADPWVGRDPDLLVAACGACHSRHVDLAAWTPGMPYLDAFEPELFDTDAYYPDGQVREELYELVSFQSSRMYAEGVRCWNCHDPHANGTLKPGNETCLGCHESRYGDASHTHHADGSAGAACTGCHMPVTVYMKRDPRHDHSFGRPDPELTIALNVPNACNRCHTDRDAAWAAAQVGAWYPDDTVRRERRAVATAIAQARGGDAASVPALLALLAGPADPIRRASAARLLARFPTSPGTTPGLLTALHDPAPLVRAGAAWSLAQRPSLAPDARDAMVATLDDPVLAVRLHAALALRGVAPADLPEPAARALARATAEWRTSQELGSDTPEAHFNLAIVSASQGRLDEAEREYRAALRLWPRSIQARHNLAMLLARQGRPEEAATELETLLANDPVPASAFALGLLYGQMGRWHDAAAALERCLAEDPSYPRARYNRALALAKTGDTTAALDELELATDDPAARLDAVRTLVDLSRQVKDETRLKRWVLEAARIDRDVQIDPGARELLGR
jgi:tetratricopeptide (TPR) repeat protein